MADQFDPKAWTREHEGFRDEVYLDSRGLPTVGVGHLITETSPYFGAQEGDLLSTKHLEEQYDKDYASHAELASKNFKNFDKHPQHVKDALINMTFQLGNKPKKWKNFQGALDEGLKTGNYQNAAYHGADSKWFRDQTPKRARSVLDRLAYGSDYNYTRPDALADLPDYTSPRQAAKATPAAQLAAPAPPPVAEDPSWWDRVKAVAGYADGTLTNPEAGPSDTVPAMLTPGEAVIPASVAMDPDYKPAIKEMVNEGRRRNDAAESAGIPVNHAAAARPPGEQQGYMGGVPHVDGYADGIGGAFDKLLPESIKAKWQEAKDTKTGVEDAYSAYKWLDEKDAQLRDMSGGYLGIPTWQDPINWELVGEYGDEALKGARTYGKYKRKAGEALDAIGLADGAEGQKTINIPGYGEIPEYLAYSVPGLGAYLNTKNALEAGLGGDWEEAAKQGGLAASNFIPIPQSLQKLAGAGLQTAGKFVGLQGGTDMIPKPMGAPPKYNVDRPDHGEFNVPTENMGEGTAMDLANAKHRQQVANKEGDQAQKMDHAMQTDMYKMQMDDMKGKQKLQQKMDEKNLDMKMKMMEADVDSEVSRRKQEALTTSMNGLGLAPPEQSPPPMGIEPPGGIPGLADGGQIWPEDVVIDGQFMTEHVPPIQGYADGGPIQGYADGGPIEAEQARLSSDFGNLDQSGIGDLASLIPKPAPAPEDLSSLPVDRLTGRLDPAARDELNSRGYVREGGRWLMGEKAVEESYAPLVEDARATLDAGGQLTPEQQVNVARYEEDKMAGADRDKVAVMEEQQKVVAQEQKKAEEVAMVNEQRASVGLPPMPEEATVDSNTTPPEVNDTTTKSATDAAVNTPPEEKAKWYDSIKDTFSQAFGSLINEQGLAEAAIVYGTNRLLGYDNDVAGQQALGWYGNKLEGERAAKADAAKRQAERADFVFEETTKAGIAGQKDSAQAQNKFVDDSRKYNVSQAKAATSKGGFAYDEHNSKPYVSATPQKLAAEHTDFLKEYGFTDFESDVATGMFETAMRRASEAARSGKEIRSIKPYLHAAMMTQESGLGEGAFSRIDKKTGVPTPIDTGNINGLNKVIEGNLSGGATRQKRLRALGAAYENLAPDQRARWEDKAEARGDVTGFYLFARQRAEQLQQKLRG